MLYIRLILVAGSFTCLQVTAMEEHANRLTQDDIEAMTYLEFQECWYQFGKFFHHRELRDAIMDRIRDQEDVSPHAEYCSN